MTLRNEIKKYLGIEAYPNKVRYEILETKVFEKFERQLIQYMGNESDEIRAYLFIPKNIEILGGVLVHHQHNGQRHLGKSEVSGITGDPNQFFCPQLSERGIITLAPDSISFEDRRPNKKGIEPDPDPDNDWLQHYNEMCYRILRKQTLMKKVLEDSFLAINILQEQEDLKGKEIGILGHSYGGNTVIFHSALDERIKYSCTSGALGSYETKIKHGTGIEMAEVIPGFIEQYEILDLLKCISPRKLLILSATNDLYSQDAGALYEAVRKTYETVGLGNHLSYKEFEGNHGLTKERFNYIIHWFEKEMKKGTGN